MAFTINSVGNALTPFDSFLLLRGTKTLAIRMDRQQSTSLLVAQMLQKLGFIVHYPGLPDHPGREIHERIADGKSICLLSDLFRNLNSNPWLRSWRCFIV